MRANFDIRHGACRTQEDVPLRQILLIPAQRGRLINAAVSHDDGRSWHGYREFARQALPELEDDQVSYPRAIELPDGRVLVNFAHIPDDWLKLGVEHVVFDPDVLDARTDREDFAHGLAGWSTNGCAGASVVEQEGESALLLQGSGQQPLGAERNFPFAPRGRLSFEIQRQAGSAGLDLRLDETFGRPNDRRPDPPLEINLGVDQLPTDEWLPVTVAWNVASASVQITLAGSEQRLPVRQEPLGLCYLTFHGRSKSAESGGILVRRLETEVED